MTKLKTLLLAVVVTAVMADIASAINVTARQRRVHARTANSQFSFVDNREATSGSTGVFNQGRSLVQGAGGSQNSNIIEMASMLQVLGQGSASASETISIQDNDGSSTLSVEFLSPNGGMFDLSGASLNPVSGGSARISLQDLTTNTTIFNFTSGTHSTNGTLESGHNYRFRAEGFASPEPSGFVPDSESASWNLGQGFKVTGNLPSAVVPEPTSTTLLALAGCAIVRRRRKA